MIRMFDARSVVETWDSKSGGIVKSQTVEAYQLGTWEAMQIGIAIGERAQRMEKPSGRDAVEGLAALFGSDAAYTLVVTRPAQ